MRRIANLALGHLALGLGLAAFAAPAASAQTPLTTQLVVNGLSSPLFVTAPAGDARLFIVEKGGRIKIVSNGAVLPTPFLNLSGKVNSSSEQGLLGMAFDPDYANNGFFYVNYTTGSGAGKSVVARVQVSSDPDVADAATETTVLELTQTFTNHNGGMLAFSHDEFLLIGFGDGGSSNDPSCNAQNLTTWLGKMLRIDVSGGLPYTVPPDNPFVGMGGGVLPEIYYLGLRNPWRYSVDALTGDVYIGDVGQNAKEEISFAGAGESAHNFGWKVMESIRCNSSSSCPGGTPACNDPAYTDPIYDLPHNGFSGPLAVIGGYVYRGGVIPDLVGTYFFADFNDDKIRSFEYDPVGGVQNFMDRTAELAPGGGLNIRSIAAFGEDGFGELYMCDLNGGEVFQIVPDEPVTITGVTPDPFDSVIPGTAQALTIDGSGFSPLTTVTLGGVPVDAGALTFVNSSQITFDPPQVPALGTVSLAVDESGQSASADVTIKAPDLPALQLGDGEVPNVVSVSSGLDILAGGSPGRLHYVLYSSSNLPSVHPLISLDIGNNFTDLFLAHVFVIPGQGWDGINLTLPPSSLFLAFYSQTVALGAGQGIEVSNLQSIVVGL